MQLTGKQIIEQNIVTNFCKEGIQQQGVDVRVAKLYRVLPGLDAYVPAEGKTKLPYYEPVEPEDGKFVLGANEYYEVVLMEGCNIPNHTTLHFKTRSSLVRCGANIFSGQFDAGFHTENAGCFLQTSLPITIEVGARVAQAICFESEPVDNLYDGQWQEDKQRK